MVDVSAFQRQGVSPFMSLPPELRRRIYHFAIVEPHPLPLVACRLAKIYAVQKDLRMLDICGEFRTLMKDLLYSENSFAISTTRLKVEEGTTTFQVDPKRIQNCYISINDLTDCFDKVNEDGEPNYYSCEFCPDVHDIQEFVAMLAFNGHQMNHLLVECEPQSCAMLREGLSPFSMLRNIHLVHFRSCQAEIYHYFRFLEGLMMGDRPVPFRDLTEFWEESHDLDDLLRRPDQSWLVERLDLTISVMNKSEEQMEVTAKELYSILGMKRDFIPQSELGALN